MAQAKTNRAKWEFSRDAFWRAINGRMEVDHVGLRDAASEIGVSHSTLWRISKHNPDIDTVVRVCQWLRMTVDAFVVGK